MELFSLMMKASTTPIICWLLTLTCGSVSGQIDYKIQVWKIPEKVWSVIDRHQECCKDSANDYYNPKVEKLVVSAFIGWFKYSGYDPRSSAKIKSNAFQGSFPQPPLKMLDPVMERVCRASSADCVHYVFKHLQAVSLEKHSYKYGHKSYPYRNYSVVSVRHRKENITPLQLFHFQVNFAAHHGFLPKIPQNHDLIAKETNAMYFLCHRAILLDDAVSDAHWSCRYPGRKTSEKLRGRCFLNAVCPDPCCGTRLVNDTDRECHKVPEGVCSVVLKKLTTCQRTEGFLDYKDMAIGQLARNGPSYVCQCPESTMWDLDYLTCVDEDECLSGKHKCDPASQYCVNRVKGYFCACLWGYYPKSRFKCRAADVNRLTVTTNSTNATITTTTIAPEIGIENLEEYVMLKMRQIAGPLLFPGIPGNRSRPLPDIAKAFPERNKTEWVKDPINFSSRSHIP